MNTNKHCSFKSLFNIIFHIFQNEPKLGLLETGQLGCNFPKTSFDCFRLSGCPDKGFESLVTGKHVVEDVELLEIFVEEKVTLVQDARHLTHFL
jgi:hypothetical protein